MLTIHDKTFTLSLSRPCACLYIISDLWPHLLFIVLRTLVGLDQDILTPDAAGLYCICSPISSYKSAFQASQYLPHWQYRVSDIV